MDGFRVKTDKIRSCGGELCDYSTQLSSASDRVNLIRNALRGKISGSENIGYRLRKISELLEQSGNHTKDMGIKLDGIGGLYQKTEHSLLDKGCVPGASVSDALKDNSVNGNSGNTGDHSEKSWWDKFLEWLGIKKGFTETELDSIISDEKGEYGGDQGSPQKEWGWWSQKKDLYQTIRNNRDPNMTDKECRDYLKALDKEGCGYVAVINTIFAAYEGREKEFEKIFGFSMYRNGDLNYDRLLVDFYSSTDNHNPREDGTDYEDTAEGEAGVTLEKQKYRALLYLREKGVPIEIKTNYEVTVENFAEATKDGYIEIAYHNGKLQDKNGKEIANINGHGMIITGVTSDGRYKVSSWGKEYYIDPKKNYPRLDKNGVMQNTRMSYAYFSYGNNAHQVSYS